MDSGTVEPSSISSSGHFLKSKFVHDALSEKSSGSSSDTKVLALKKKRMLQELKLDVMSFHNLRTRAKSLHQEGSFVDAIAVYTHTLEVLTKIINIEAGRAAEEELKEEEEIHKKEQDRLKREKYEPISRKGNASLRRSKAKNINKVDTESMEHKKREDSLLSPNKLAERKRNRAYRLSKHLQQIVPIEIVVKIYLGRASCFSKISDYRRSIEDANSALSLDPSCVQAYVRRGEALMQLQQFREASDTFREGLTVDPTHRVLKKRFADSLRGLRVQWHQYFPTYGHSSASTEIAGDPTDAPSGVNRLQESFINPTEAHQDVEIKEVCAQSGMKFDVLDLLKQEAQWWTTNAMRYADGVAQARDFDSAHVHVVRSLIKHKSDLLLLFTKYCEADYDARLSRSFRLSSFVTIGVDGGIHSSPLDIANATNEGVNMPQPPTTRKKKHHNQVNSRYGNNISDSIHHHRPPYTPKSERLLLPYDMCKQMFLDFGLITPSFGTSMLSNVWEIVNRDVLNAFKTLPTGRPTKQKSLRTREAEMVATPETINTGTEISQKPSQEQRSKNSVSTKQANSKARGYSILFPKFLEVVVRMCYGRYKPITADGIRPPTFVERLESALNKHFIPSAVAIRAASEAGTAQPSLVTAETDSAWINENVLEIMEAYKPRLGKVFDYFSQKDRVSKKMDLMEFLFVLKSLGLVDAQRATLHAGCKIFVSITGYTGAMDNDKIDLNEFIEALARFGDIRTHDGMVSLPKRLNAFFSNVVLQKARHRTDIAALWL